MARILLGVSGGIAAYKALELVRLATGAGHSVRVIQTETSQRFVGEASFAALTGAPVLVSEFARDPMRGAFPDQPLPDHEPISHLELLSNAEVFIVAPASANTIAKLAAGMADNLLSTAALAADCPVLLAPAMNNRMYEHPATQANLHILRERGVTIVEPDAGRLASKGEQGVGRLAEPARLLEACEQALSRPSGPVSNNGVGALQGVRVLITAGGTREPIDSVRYIGNNSSGRMGLALARAAQERGAQVTLIAANVAIDGPAGVRRIEVSTAAELGSACDAEFEACDVLLMSAAVADFTPAVPREGKIKKTERPEMELTLEPTRDVIAALAARRRPGQTLVGFAAEHGEQAVDYGAGKLAAKRLDAVVVNDISRSDIGFDSEQNEVAILTSSNGSGIERRDVARAEKLEIARAILDTVQTLRADAE
jgi:phosphopantothenoylcysteine decarboxylase/phosphopantothenate--cysteine ligase